MADAERELTGLNLDAALRLLRAAGYAGVGEGEPVGAPLLQRVIDGLCDLSQRDGLTGLANARHFHLALERELDRVARTGAAAALLLIDIDHFKLVNDTHGHLAGDQALRAVGEALLRGVRPMDLVARTGGEEFGVILPGSSPQLARVAAERLRARVENTAIELPSGAPVNVTVSIGGAAVAPWERVTSRHLIELADRHLYAAKHQGRNRVSLAPAPSAAVTNDERVMLLERTRKRKHD
ncbi:MAG: GGDEF domain-containing protein [Burkholderiales bacterium]|nr:GGDEF domain-containing protein [Burkholderiales bacterium]